MMGLLRRPWTALAPRLWSPTPLFNYLHLGLGHFRRSSSMALLRFLGASGLSRALGGAPGAVLACGLVTGRPKPSETPDVLASELYEG